jgi:hypothetical protein
MVNLKCHFFNLIQKLLFTTFTQIKVYFRGKSILCYNQTLVYTFQICTLNSHFSPMNKIIKQTENRMENLCCSLYVQIKNNFMSCIVYLPIEPWIIIDLLLLLDKPATMTQMKYHKIFVPKGCVLCIQIWCVFLIA